MSESLMGTIVFFLLAALTLGGAFWVAFSKNIVHSAFALLATLIGAAGLYAFLSAELMVVLQVMVYVGGVLVVMIFAVMLTSRISEANVSNPSIGRIPGALLLIILAGGVGFVAFGVFGESMKNEPSSVADIGSSLLGAYLLPFQVAAIVLFTVLIGAVSIARGVTKEELPGRGASKEPLPHKGTDETKSKDAEGEAA